MAQTKLHRPIEQFIWQSEETARGSEEVVLPPQEIVRLAHQGVDEGILDLQVRVPDTKCGVVEIRGFGRGTGARCDPRRSPAAIDARLIAKQVELEHGRWANPVEFWRFCFESEPAVSNGGLQARVATGLRQGVSNDVVVQSVVEAPGRVPHSVGFGEAVDGQPPVGPGAGR